MSFSNPFQPGYDPTPKVGNNQADRIRITSDRSRVQYLLDTPDDWRGHGGDVLVVNEDDSHLIFKSYTASGLDIVPPIAGLNSENVYGAILEIKAGLDSIVGGIHGNGSVTLHSDVSNAGSGIIISTSERNKLNSIQDLIGDSGVGGVHGLVPAPAAGDAVAGKYLKANGLWEAIPDPPPAAVSGDVFGPSTAVNGNVVIFNGTTGKLIKDSGLKISGINTGDEKDATTSIIGVVRLATDGQTASGVAVQGSDSRLNNARFPTSHASTHITGQSDAIQLATNLQDGLATATQITKLNGIQAGAEVNPSVVPKAEAEAGVATTERIWTAQRVKQSVQSLTNILEIKSLLKIGQVNYYTEFTNDIDDQPINIDKWTDSMKGTKLFTKTLTWVAGLCTQTVTTDETTGAVLTVDYTYDGNDNVITSTEVLT